MKVEMVDFTLHLRDRLDEGRLQDLERGVHELDGILSTHRSSDHPQIMLVAVNPERTNSTSVLAYLAEQGVDAELYVPEHV